MTPDSPYPWFYPLLARLRAHLASEPFSRDAAHDLGHILRVARLAGELAAEERADAETCVAAALLHDLVYRPKNHPESPLTARLAAELVPQWCRETPGLEAHAEAIAAAVATHSWSGGQAPGSLEAAVLQDADRLEALGDPEPRWPLAVPADPRPPRNRAVPVAPGSPADREGPVDHHHPFVPGYLRGRKGPGRPGGTLAQRCNHFALFGIALGGLPDPLGPEPALTARVRPEMPETARLA